MSEQLYDDHTPLSDPTIPIHMQAAYGPQVYHYTCYFAHYPGFSGGYAFVDPVALAKISLYTILTEQRLNNPDAINYLRFYYPDLLL